MELSGTARDEVSTWEELRERFPWPDERPPHEPIHWSLDYGGRALVTRLIRQRRVKVVLEVGVFLGGSVRRWLAAAPDVVVIAVDQWYIPNDENDFIIKHSTPEISQVFSDAERFYQTFLATMWDVRQRVIPVRGDSLQKLHELHALGLRPDLVYLDCDKRGGEIALCGQLFPNAIITGDDWYWGGDQGFPIRRPVREYCRANHRHLKRAAMTWAIDDRPATRYEQLWRMRYFPHEIGLWCYGAYHYVQGLRGNRRSVEKTEIPP